jgi:hypothetical protein
MERYTVVVHRLLRFVAVCVATLILNVVTIGTAMATNPVAEYENPSFGAMTADLLVTRPITLVATVFGGAVFLLSSPFAAMGDNIDQSAETLVKMPFRATFSRCLGCSVDPQSHY